VERLDATLAEALECNEEFCMDNKYLKKRAEAAEAKLAKAVEALEKLNVGEGWAAQAARTTLAELEGETDD